MRRYTFSGLCDEDPDFSLGDGATKVFLNAKGSAGLVSDRLLAFLDYLNGHTEGNDDFVCRLDDEVRRVRDNDVWRLRRMLMATGYQCDLADARYEAREEGRAEGIADLSRLATVLAGRGELERLTSVLQDPDALAALMSEVLPTA